MGRTDGGIPPDECVLTIDTVRHKELIHELQEIRSLLNRIELILLTIKEPV